MNFKVVRGEELWEHIGNLCFEAEALKQFIRETPNVPERAIETVIEGLTQGGAIRGDYANVCYCGFVFRAMLEEAQTAQGKEWVEMIAARTLECRLPATKQPGWNRPGEI